MKSLLLIVFISSCLFSFGQTNMFWNHYSNFNSATSGLQYEQHAAISGFESWQANKGLDLLQANYNHRIFEHHGLGINYSLEQNVSALQLVTANYNYQFDLKDAGRLSIGTGIGLVNQRIRKTYEYLFDSTSLPSPKTTLNLTLGTAYSWKNLLVGVSTTNLNLASSEVFTPAGLNFHASYDFRLSRTFELTPRAVFQTQGGFRQLVTNVTATYKSKYALGVSYNFNSTFGVNIGYDIKDKFRVAYMVSKTWSKLSNGTFLGGIGHELSLGYILKNQPRKTIHPISPEF